MMEYEIKLKKHAKRTQNKKRKLNLKKKRFYGRFIPV